MQKLFIHRTIVEKERSKRIRVALAAYAYEIANMPFMSDAEYDSLAKSIDLTIRTGRLDEWFVANYSSYTGQWIHNHPELTKIRKLHERHYA